MSLLKSLRSISLNRIVKLSDDCLTRSPIRLVLYTKKNCTLCDEAKEEIENLYPNRFLIEEIDITKDRTLLRKFKLDIPVFYCANTFLMHHRVDKKALDNLMLLLKNLNVSNLDKNLLKELEFSDSNATIDTLVNQVANKLNLNPAQIELVYRGEVLSRSATVQKYLKNLNQNALLFISENKTPNVSNEEAKPSLQELESLHKHVAYFFKSRTRRYILEKLLQNNEKFMKCLNHIPDLKNDPVSLNFVQNIDLIKLIGDKAKSESIITNNPNIYYAVKALIDHVKERSKTTSEEEIGNFVSKASYSIDDMSEDEDEQQQQQQRFPMLARTQQQQAQSRQGPALTQDYFASVLASIARSSQQQQQQQSQQPSVPVQQQQQQQAQAQPQMSRDYLQNVLSQMFAPRTNENVTSAQPQQQQQQQQQQSSGLSDSDIATKLEQMHEIGLLDDELNVRALQIAGGNVDAAVSLIMEGGDI